MLKIKAPVYTGLSRILNDNSSKIITPLTKTHVQLNMPYSKNLDFLDSVENVTASTILEDEDLFYDTEDEDLFEDAEDTNLELMEDIPYNPEIVTNWRPASKQEFVQVLEPIVEKTLLQKGINPQLWKKYLITHMAIESGYGQSDCSYKCNNFAGMKALKSQDGTYFKTLEYDSNKGQNYTIVDKFRNFDSVNDFVNYYIDRLKYKFHAFDSSPVDYLKNIKKHGYFTADLNLYTNLFNEVFQTVSKLSFNSNVESFDMDLPLEQLFSKHGIRIKVFRDYEKGARTKLGKISYHSQRDALGRPLAYDIGPVDGNFAKLKYDIMHTPEILAYLEYNNLGVLDETLPWVMAKTGATGPHFHIGPDNWAKQFLNDWKKELTKI